MPRTRPSKNSSCARVSNSRHSTIVRYIRSRTSRSRAERRSRLGRHQYGFATNSSADGKRVITCGPFAVTTTSSSIRAAL